MVLRRENAGRPARIQLYRNEDQSVEPNKTLTLGGNVSDSVWVGGYGLAHDCMLVWWRAVCVQEMSDLPLFLI